MCQGVPVLWQVEGLLDGEDFAAKVTREEYLELVKDMLDRVTKPVEDALKASEITMVSVNGLVSAGCFLWAWFVGQSCNLWFSFQLCI